MPFDGNGVFSFSGATFPYVTGQIVDATKQTANANDIASGLTNCITKDGQTTVVADIPMGSKKFTGLANGTADGDSVNVSQLNVALSRGSCKNKLINGNFNVNQRNVSSPVTLAAGAYGHDGWKAGAAGCTYSFVTASNVTTLTITAGSLQQVVEGINLFSGTYVMSWSGTATGKIGAGILSPSGITGAATGGTNLTVEFATGTLSQVQLEQGSTATSFDIRSYGAELIFCKRYLPSQNSGSGGSGAYYPGQAFSSSTGFIPMPFDVQARIPPTGIQVVGAGGYTVNHPSGAGVVVAVAFNTGSTAGGGLSFSGASELSPGGATCLAIPTGQTLLWTGCEL